MENSKGYIDMIETKPWNLVEHLNSNEARVAYMEAVVEEIMTMNDPSAIMKLLDDTVIKVLESLAIEVKNKRLGEIKA